MEVSGLNKDLAVMPTVFGKMEFTLLISKKSKFGKSFLGKFDAILDAMKKDGSYQQLVDKLIGVNGNE